MTSDEFQEARQRLLAAIKSDPIISKMSGSEGMTLMLVSLIETMDYLGLCARCALIDFGQREVCKRRRDCPDEKNETATS